jgi:hypothetical protein
MGRSFLRQDTQVFCSLDFTDNLAAGSALETGTVDLETDFAAVRSQLKRILDHTSGKWYDDVSTVNSKKRSLKTLNTYLDALETHKFLFRVQLLTTVTVPNAQNYVVLSQASSETPSEVAAVNAGTANGAIVASLAADVGAHSLNLVAGYNAVNPKNLVLIHDSATSDLIMDGTKEVYGLLQAESGVVDGNNFNDTNKQVQISFVKENAGGTALVAANVSAIQNQVIHYAYTLRDQLDSIPEYAFLSGVMVDQAAAVDVTLTNAIANQSGPAPQTQNIEWRIDDTRTLKFETSDGGVALLSFEPNVAGDLVQFTTDNWKVTNAQTAEFTNGIKVDSSGTTINLGVTAGQIDAAGLKVTSTGANDLKLASSQELWLTDSYRAGSTWSLADGIKLAASSAEWSNFETKYGEVSLLNAINQATGGGTHNKATGVATGNINADTNVTGVGGGANLDAALLNYSALDFMTDVNVFVNGQLMRPGANSAANNDVYPGTTQGNGDLMFEFKIHTNDVVTMEIFG